MDLQPEKKSIHRSIVMPRTCPYRLPVKPGDVARSERREAPRFPVTLAVKFNGGQGCTRDVSASGMFFTTEWPFRVGSPIRFTLVLDHAEPGRQQEVTCEGVVVRMEPGGQGHGVAVSINSLDLGEVEGRSGGGATRASTE